MRHYNLAGIMLAATLACSTFAVAQNDSGTKQSMKNAGTETKEAGKDVGHGVAQGTKKSYHATKHVTTKAAKKTGTGTRNLGRRIEGKPTVPNNPQ